MSLHVKICPKWTFGSHCSFGRRGYLTGSSRRSSSFLTTSVGFGLSRLNNISTVSQRSCRQSLRCIQSPPSLCSSRTEQSSLVPQHRAAFFATSAHDRDTSSTNVEVEDSNNGTPLPNTASSTLNSPTTSNDTVDQTALDQSERVGKDDGSASLQSGSLAHDRLSLTTDGQDDTIVDGEYPKNYGLDKKFSRRQLPRNWLAELARLGVLLLEERKMEEIRDAFRDSINVRDSLWRSHGLELDPWLCGPWNHVKSEQVMQLLLGSIVTSPHSIIGVLRHMGQVDHDFHVRASCLSYTGFLYKDMLATSQSLMVKFDMEVRKLALPHQWPEVMSSREMSLLLWCIKGEKARDMIKLLLQKYPDLDPDTRCYLAMYCSVNSMESLALEILTSLPSSELQSPNTTILKCCAVLLQHDVVEHTPAGPNFKFLPRLLEKGLTPDNMLYARIIERALASGYPAVAWDIFRHLKTTGIEITGWTYIILLRHSFEVNNATGLQELMSEIQQEKALYTNVYILTYTMNIVRRIFARETEMTTAESLSYLLTIYDRRFSRDALVKLEIVPSVGSSKSSATSSQGGAAAAAEVVEPDAYCLSFTIWAYVLCHRRSGQARKVWERIQALLEAGDAKTVECMRLDLVYNAFIWLYLKHGQQHGMAGALEIFQYMLSKQLCVPTDRTWSILICGFLRLEQKTQAKNLYELMKQCDLTMKDIRQEYWRHNWTFEYFEEHLDEILDENKMPDGTEVVELSSDEAREKEVLEKLQKPDPDVESSMWTWPLLHGGVELAMGNRSSSTS